MTLESEIEAANGLKAKPGRLAAERKRAEWIRQNLAQVCGNGADLYDEDVEALPSTHRAEARAIARRAIDLHQEGDQQLALEHAREAFAALDAKIGRTWSPPAHEPPDPALLDRIRGVAI